MLRTSDFIGIVKGRYDYLFFLVCSGHWYYGYEGDPLEKILEGAFARNLGSRAAVVTSFSEDAEANFHSVMAKDWPDEIIQTFEALFYPIVLGIETDFESFDPQRDRHMILEFREYDGDPELFVHTLREIENLVISGEDLFPWWENHKTTETQSIISRIINATNIRPGVFGIDFDIKKFFRR